VTIHCVNPLEEAGWDEALAPLPGSAIFHGAAWTRVIQDTYAYRPFSFLGGAAGEPRSILSVMEVDSPLTGKRGVSLPFTDECEPPGADADSFPGLFRDALDCARRRGWRYLEVRGGKTFLPEAPASTSYYGHRLDLRDGESALYRRLDSSVRRALRKAEQSGLTVEFSQELAAVRDFHHLLRKTRQRHGMPPQPFKFFANLHRHILAPNQGRVVLARHNGVAIAGAVFFQFGRTALFKFGASDSAFQNLRANNLVMWRAIEWHVRQGFTSLDFGRTSLDNEGLRRFKLSWGSQERPIEYIRYDLRTESFVRALDRSTGWHNRIFRLLPGPFAQAMGSVLYKHLG